MKPYFTDEQATLYLGDALTVLQSLPDASINCCVTSPPYFGLRDYGVDGQLGAEETPTEYLNSLVAIMAEVRRVLAKDGTAWLNIGDSYARQGGGGRGAGSALQGRKHGAAQEASNLRRRKPGVTLPEKNLMLIPQRLIIALQEDGWIVRQQVIWAKPNGMPESVADRLTSKHEVVFLLTRSPRYWFDLGPLREPPAYPEAADGSRVFGGRRKADDPAYLDAAGRRRGSVYGKAAGSNLQPTGRQHLTPERAQKRRARELFDASGLTDAHLAAMRAVGMSDAGKALTIQDGAGKNAVETQRLADEAKAALGGYYREFLYDEGRNPGDWWVIPTQPFAEAHFATFPVELPRRCIAAGCKPGGVVLDPFSGSGTTGLAAAELGRRYVGIDLNRDYLELSLRTRLSQPSLTAELGS